MTTLTLRGAEHIAFAALRRAGAEPHQAEPTARALVAAETAGQSGALSRRPGGGQDHRRVGDVMSTVAYARHRFPPAIIQHAVWLCFRFTLSYRDVEDLLAARGIVVSYETVRRWALKFGRVYAALIRQRRPRPSGRWHLDEVFIRIGGKTRYLWRAVDDEGEVLDIVVQPRRNRKAALKLMRRMLKRQGYLPEAIVTDRLRSYGAALRDLDLTDRHVMGGRSNNRAEVSHQPTRQRERHRRGFRSPRSAQRFLASHAAVYNHFNVQRHLISRSTMRHLRSQAFAVWLEIAAA